MSKSSKPETSSDSVDFTRKPKAKTLSQPKNANQEDPQVKPRSPRAFDASDSIQQTDTPEDWLRDETLEKRLSDENPPKRNNWVLRIAVGTIALLISLAMGLALDNLIRELFATYDWLGWIGLSVTLLFVLTIMVLIGREIVALRRLKNLGHLRDQAEHAFAQNDQTAGRDTVNALQQIYHDRIDLAEARAKLDVTSKDIFDGPQLVLAAEAALMSPLDRRALALISASARRVTVVTAISPRAIVDIAFIAYESIKLARNISRLYGSRPGLFSSWRLIGAVLSHLALTGGIAMGDSFIQQLIGHGLAAKLSARLGEGFINGLMTCRVGIAAMKVTRPLPFKQSPPPKILDFATELAKITTKN